MILYRSKFLFIMNKHLVFFSISVISDLYIMITQKICVYTEISLLLRKIYRDITGISILKRFKANFQDKVAKT